MATVEELINKAKKCDCPICTKIALDKLLKKNWGMIAEREEIKQQLEIVKNNSKLKRQLTLKSKAIKKNMALVKELRSRQKKGKQDD